MSTSDETIHLYEYGPTRSARCRWMLQELGVPFESHEVDLPRGEHRGEAYLRVNPMGRVPALVWGEVTLFESAAICLFLGDRFPESGLLPPAGSAARGVHDQWVLFVMTELDQPLWRIRRHTLLYPPKRRVPADVPVAREDFCQAARVLEGALGEREYLVGDGFTVADILAAHTLQWATWYDLLEGFPALRAYAARHLGRAACPEVLRG